MKNRTLLLVLVVLLAGTAGFIYYKKTYLPKYRWLHYFQRDNDQPYGLSLMHQLLKNKAGKLGRLRNTDFASLDTSSNTNNLIFINHEFVTDSAETQALLRYIEKGNRILIASNFTPMELLRQFVPLGDSLEWYDYRNDSLVSMSFTQTQLPYKGRLNFHHRTLKDTTSTEWCYYRGAYMDTVLGNWGFTPISQFEDSCVNAFYLRHGRGQIVVHCNPLLFTNFYLSSNEGYLHANNFLAYLQKGDVYWLDLVNNYDSNSSSNWQHPDNPLRFLFTHPYLKWGWYVFLSGILLYLLFRSRRSQRVIPPQPDNHNTSIAYTKAIGSLYFQHRSHRQIAHEMYLVFLAEVRSRYNLSTDVDASELARQLSQRSGLSQAAISNLLKQFVQLQNANDVSDGALLRLHDAVNYYHKKRK